MKIVHLITGLEVGGAEFMLLNLIKQLKIQSVENTVISMTSVGHLGQEIRSLGVTVEALNMPRGRIRLSALLKLLKILREIKPDILQTWLYHSDLLGGLTRLAGSRVPVIWGIHHSTEALHLLKPTTRLVVQLNRFLAFLSPRFIICCSDIVYRTHRAMGYPKRKMKLIPNGIDPDCFKPDPGVYISLRKQLGVTRETILIGHSGRFVPEKAHDIFIQSAGLIAQHHPDIHFVMVGNSIDLENSALLGSIRALYLEDKIHLMGQISRLDLLLPGLDIFVSSSLDEALPLTVIEAMACQIPCVVTDVGDQGQLVGDSGIIVPPGSEKALAEGCLHLLSMSSKQREDLGLAARAKILKSYTLERTATEYLQVYREVIP